MTVLFADLVGFTARAERLDPEDVRALLAPYHAHLRSELERFGGTVEKFIGDAVMALFGAPVAHEDDPERAVRAALAIRDWAVEQGEELQVRIAVNTGEALVTLGARPSEGEAMAAGDVVNTAARLQAAAPLNGDPRRRADLPGDGAGDRVPRGGARGRPRERASRSPPGRRSRRARASASTCRSGPSRRSSAAAASSSCSSRRWRACARSARRSSSRSSACPGSARAGSCYELFRTVDAGAATSITLAPGPLAPLRRGRDVLGAGRDREGAGGHPRERRAPSRRRRSSRRAVDAVAADAAEAHWLERAPAPARRRRRRRSRTAREEGVAAWRRFLEALAEERPLVLVFEDLHWADDALLDFVDQLVERARGVPLLVLGTARPELLQRRPGWGGGKPNALTISLSPLSDEETARLRPVAARAAAARRADAGGAARPRRRQPALRRAVRAHPARARRRADELPGDGAGDHRRAARRALGGGEAAAPGRRRRRQGLLARGGRGGRRRRPRWQAEELLHALERKEFVQRARALLGRGRERVRLPPRAHPRRRLRPDPAGGALGQAPARGRAGSSRSAGPRTRPRCSPTTTCRRSSWQRPRGSTRRRSRSSARHALRDAGDRAAALYAVEAAERFYDAALRLWPDDDPERAQLLFRRAAPVRSLSVADATRAPREARDALLAAGDDAKAGRGGDAPLRRCFWFQGRRDLADEHAGSGCRAARRRAAEQVERMGPRHARATLASLARRP